MKQRFLVGAWLLLALPVVAITVLICLAILPHLTLIGWVAAGVIVTGLVCLAVLSVSFTYNKTGSWAARRRHDELEANVTRWEVGAALVMNGAVINMSATHEQAKIQPPDTVIQALSEPAEPDIIPSTVMELHEDGQSLRQIADLLGTNYNRIQAIYAKENKKQERAQKRKKAVIGGDEA